MKGIYALVHLIVLPTFKNVMMIDDWNVKRYYLYLYFLHVYPGYYSYTEGATWKILDLSTETLFT